MVTSAIHRKIEQHAAARPDATAVADSDRTLTYRELNQRANAVARWLGGSGLTRGGAAIVRIDPGADLLIALLAVLKAGAAYTWIDPAAGGPCDLPSFAIACRSTCAAERRYRAVDIRRLLAESVARPSPNLPILTRGTDIACILADEIGAAHVLVPHAVIVSMREPARAASARPDPGAFGYWIRLMTGGTVTFAAVERGPALSTASAAA